MSERELIGSKRTQHSRLAEQLASDIANGTYAVGDRLPTEAELCATHGLARGTVRQAMRHLEDQGLVIRRPSAGTRVISQRPLTRYAPFASSTKDIVDFAKYTQVQNPRTSQIRADNTLARRLGVDVGTSWFLVEGPRSSTVKSGPPLCWSEQFMRADLPFRDELVQANFDMASMDTHRIEQEVGAGLLPEAFAEALAAQPLSAALVVMRRHINPANELLSISIHTHPADRFRITSVLVPAETTTTADIQASD